MTNKGKHWKLSEENKRNISLSKQGSKHPNWKDGITKSRFYQREYLRKIRNDVIEILGNKCIRCGFDDKRALQIDHIDGGGSKERKERGFSKNFHLYVIESFKNGENKYQCLCANCNWIKRFEEKECEKNSKCGIIKSYKF